MASADSLGWSERPSLVQEMSLLIVAISPPPGVPCAIEKAECSPARYFRTRTVPLSCALLVAHRYRGVNAEIKVYLAVLGAIVTHMNVCAISLQGVSHKTHGNISVAKQTEGFIIFYHDSTADTIVLCGAQPGREKISNLMSRYSGGV